jgi:hypothetical protein
MVKLDDKNIREAVKCPDVWCWGVCGAHRSIDNRASRPHTMATREPSNSCKSPKLGRGKARVIVIDSNGDVS